MSAIRSRLAKLEEAHGDGASRLIVMHANRSMPDGACNAFLATQGIIVGRSDQVVCLTTIYEDRDGNDTPEATPPALLSVHQQRRARL